MNPDAIQLARKNYPAKQFAAGQIAEFVDRMRQTVNPKTGLSRKTEWLEAVKKGLPAQVKRITTEKRLQLFGITHNYTNKITAEGIRMELNHQKLFFEVPRDRYYFSINNIGIR